MKKYSEIMKKTKSQKKENNILYGWYLLKRDKDNQLIIEKNKDDYSVEYIEYFTEKYRLYELYLNNIERLMNYKIEEYEKENIEYNVEEILQDLGYYDDEDEEDYYYNEEQNENSDYEYSD